MDALVTTIAKFIIADAIAMGGYGGVVLLMALESACLPIPSEIVMPFSGYLAATGRFNLLLTATAGALGCNAGSTLTYFAGAYGGRPFIEKWGRYFLVKTDKLERLENYFERFGAATVFVARVLPMLPAFISFPAGVARMPMWKFQLYTFAGTWIWCFALTLAGFEFGREWRSNTAMQRAIHMLDVSILVLVAIAIAWLALKFQRARFHRNAK